jgi:hypothetical protein
MRAVRCWIKMEIDEEVVAGHRWVVEGKSVRRLPKRGFFRHRPFRSSVRCRTLSNQIFNFKRVSLLNG